ncbi:flagellar basal-body MS-ring/collar protein FliF [Hahella sp. SMD15-11]|uniref:Flagellar M-ring protein n=1 Tax=Thermohahella caldifontis TaxID=3142973 RepID=A0AB39UX26_9GAMM
MASVPAEIPTADNLPLAGGAGGGDGDAETPRSDLVMGFNKLSIMRQVALMIGLAASIAMGIAIILWAQQPDYQPVFSDLRGYDPTEIADILNQADVKFRMDPKTGALLVASEDVHRARLKLAAAGVTEDKTVGFELLDQAPGLGTSQFMESARYRRSLEGELARTIASLRNVKSARVHLAIPKSSVFVRDRRKPSASVLVNLMGRGTLSEEQVAAIVNLVAGSVPELDKSDVTVVDQRGNLLSRKDINSDDLRRAREFEYARKLEEVLSERVGSILEPIVGPGRYRAEVSADIDFTTIERAEELYGPDQKIVRSEKELDEQRVAGDTGGIPGALSNQPPGQATVPEQANGANGTAGAEVKDLRKERVRNYEVDRTLSYIKKGQGDIRRLTVAVVVDDIRKVDADGNVTYEPWPKEELERLTLLVRNAVGYSAARGDSVNVINSPFVMEQQEDIPDLPIWQQAWFLQLVKWGVALIAVIVLVFGLIRPTLKNLSSGGAEERELALAADDDGLAELEKLTETEEGEEGGIGLSTDDEFMLPGASASYEKKLNALKSLIAEDPGRVANVLRQWIMSDD